MGKRRSSTSVCLHGSAPPFSGPLRCLPSLQQPQILNSKRTQAAVQRFQWTCHMTLAVPCHPVTSPATASRLKGLPAPQRQEPWPRTCLFSPSPGCSPQQRSPEQCLTECQKQRRTGSIREPGTSFPTWLLRTLHRSGDAGLVPHREHCHLAQTLNKKAASASKSHAVSAGRRHPLCLRPFPCPEPSCCPNSTLTQLWLGVFK